MKIAFNFNTRHSCSFSCSVENVLFLLCIAMQICTAATRYCSDTNYTSGSKFETNLNIVINNLVKNASSSGGFALSVSGQSPDQIYGLLQYRGDTSPDRCHNCSLEANTTIRHDCGNAISGRVYRDECFMRYENFSFFGKLDTIGFVVRVDRNYAEPDPFRTGLTRLLNTMAHDVSLAPKRFSALTSAGCWSLDSIYGLAQCWMDISIDDCRNCLSDAIANLLDYTNGTSVVGQTYVGSCNVRYETSKFVTSPPPPPSPTRIDPPANSPEPNKSRSSQPMPTKKYAIILGILGGLLLIFFVGLLAMRRKMKSIIFGKPVLHGSPYEGDQQIEEGSPINHDEHVIFNLETLIAATTNFNENNKLGQGGFGPVYKGIMPDGKEVAVKRLSLKSTQGKKQFLNEVKLVAKIQHRNLVNLLGSCAEGFERLLVYEYLPNKSLDKILFDPYRGRQLDWQKRFNIIIGIACGLRYLHEESQMRVLHRDLKASNILLDGKMNPKIADFGLARLLPEEESHVSTRVAGTYGYMAPEYAMHGKLSVKADVYSFGVVLLEIVCGRKNTDFQLSPDFESLLDLVWKAYSRGNVVDVIDRAIADSCVHEQAFRCIHVGLLCTQADASLRPLMSSVYSMVSNPSMLNLPDAIMPAFVKITWSGTPVVHASINDEPVTDLVGR